VNPGIASTLSTLHFRGVRGCLSGRLTLSLLFGIESVTERIFNLFLFHDIYFFQGMGSLRFRPLP
jgi:hypothetical protein